MKKTFLFLAALAMSAMMMAAEKTLTFDLTSNPGSWPTTNSTTPTDYTYTLDDVDYTFVLKNVKCNSGYLMMTQPASLGLPAIEGYKLTKVVAKNSSGCSTSVNVGISSSATEANYISGGEAQKWATTGSSYTYTLSETSENTVYYLYATTKNAQITELALTYTNGTTPERVLKSIYVDGTAEKLEYFVGEEFDPAGLKVMGKYDTGDDAEITSGITWSCDPEVFALGNTSVDVTAQYKDFTSEVFTVNNIVVKEKPAAQYVPVAWNEIEDGGKYFITANNDGEYYFAAKAFAAKGALAIAFDATLAPEADMWTFTKNGDAWKISAADGAGLYVTATNNGIVCAKDKGADFTVAVGSSAEFTKLTASDGEANRDICLYNQQDFRCYASTSTSGIHDLKLYGLKKEGVVTKPVFTPAEADFDQEVMVTLTAEEGAQIFYALDADVNSMNAIEYTEPIKLVATTTIYAVAKKDSKESKHVSKTYKLIPVFESLDALVESLPATDTKVKVKVTITDAVIDSFYVSGQNTNGVYVTVNGAALEIYKYNVPTTWIVGGKISGTIIAEWILYKGIPELQNFDSWEAFTYTAPGDPTRINNLNASKKAAKRVINGQIMIIREGKAYNMLGF